MKYLTNKYYVEVKGRKHNTQPTENIFWENVKNQKASEQNIKLILKQT